MDQTYTSHPQECACSRCDQLAKEEVQTRQSKAACSPCCDAWPMLICHFGWMRDPEGNRMMPYLSRQGSMWRINYCPSCGALVRNVIIPAENVKVQTTPSQRTENDNGQ